jgi:F-type H+-transporting ATPase subunit delta
MTSSSGNNEIASRYAAALFDLVKEQGAVELVERDVEKLDEMLSSSLDFRLLIRDVMLKREQQAQAVFALAEAAKFSPLTRNFLGLLARNRRLAVLPGIIVALQKQIGELKGETTAEVISARPLDKAQIDALAATLKKELGVGVKVKTMEDPSILGGLVVRVGSMLVDSSVRSKLDRLARILKSRDQTDKKTKEVA